MAGNDSGDKTEKATPKKRKDQRKKGNVFSSKDIVSVAAILVLFTMLKVMFPYMSARVMAEMKGYIHLAGTTDELGMTSLQEIAIDLTIATLLISLPVLLSGFAVNLLVTGVQTKFNFSQEAMRPKLNRINPLSGFKKIISLKSLVEVVKNIIKISIIASMLYVFLVGRLSEIVGIMFLDIYGSISFILESTMELIYTICLMFIFVSALDYIYQKWEYEKNIKMSKHDIKEEYKQMEGDPHIKGKIKEKQRQLSLSRMMQAVPDADVVIRNPEHFAVALKYNIDKDNAPMVVAKGQDELALRIVRIAEENNVTTIENKVLARAIFANSKLNQEIPMEHYTAVAEILALIYSSKN